VYIGVIGFCNCSFGSLDIWGVSSPELGFDRGLGDFARRVLVLLVWSFIQYRYTMCFSISYDLAFITSWRQFICCLLVVPDYFLSERS